MKIRRTVSLLAKLFPVDWLKKMSVDPLERQVHSVVAKMIANSGAAHGKSMKLNKS